MINVLPPDAKRELLASRTNSLLMRYIILTSVFMGLVLLEMGAVYLFLASTRQASEDTIAKNTAEAASLQQVKIKSDEFKSNLATAKTIFDSQVRYTSVIKTISDLIPSGIILDTLTIDPTTFGTPTTLEVKAKTYGDAILFRTKLNDSKKFTNTSFKNISFSPDNKGPYPYSVTYNLTFSKELLKS